MCAACTTNKTRDTAKQPICFIRDCGELCLILAITTIHFVVRRNVKSKYKFCLTDMMPGYTSCMDYPTKYSTDTLHNTKIVSRFGDTEKRLVGSGNHRPQDVCKSVCCLSIVKEKRLF